MDIPYDQLNGIHLLTAILMDAAKYESEHDNAPFICPIRLPLYDKNITDDATTVVQVLAKMAHKSRLNDYANYEAAECGVAKFLRDVVDEIWYNDTTVLQQLTAANFVLTNSNAMLTAANKKLSALLQRPQRRRRQTDRTHGPNSTHWQTW